MSSSPGRRPRSGWVAARRCFLKAIPAAVAGGLAAPSLAQQAEQPRRISRETLDCAEKIFGVDFTGSEDQARHWISGASDVTGRKARSSIDEWRAATGGVDSVALTSRF